MLHVPVLSRFAKVTDNLGANPSATPGTAVIPGAANNEGLWTQIAGPLAADVYAIFLRVSDAAVAGAAKPQLLDIGVDPAGLVAYSPIVSNIACGASALITQTGGGFRFLIPFFIKAGSTVAVRIQGGNATPGTVRVGAIFYGSPSRPEAMPVGRFSETIGAAVASSGGTTFTPGNAADGAWVLLGTTTQPLWWWQIGFQITNGTITAEYTYVEIAFGDASNKHVILRVMHGGTTNESLGNVICGNLNVFEAYCPVPAGTNIYIRGRCLNAPDTGYNGVAVGIGG